MDSVPPAKIYTRKELVMMEKFINEYHTSFYIPTIKKLAFNLPYIHTLGTHHCENTRREAFKCCREFQYVLCRHNYSERVVANFAYQIQSEWYGGNIYISIEGIAMEHFSAPT